MDFSLIMVGMGMCIAYTGMDMRGFEVQVWGLVPQGKVQFLWMGLIASWMDVGLS